MSKVPEINCTIPPNFQNVLDNNEKLLWADKPVFIPYILTTIWHNIFLLLVGAYFLYVVLANYGNMHGPSGFVGIMVPGLFAVFGLWGILNGIFSYSNTIYAISSRRVVVQTGFIGINYLTVDYDKLSDTGVNVNLFEKMFNVGTITFSDGRKDSKGNPIYMQFTSIRNPYDVFKQLKETDVDVKTDYDYPNALRPKDNPGYQTEYERE